ncbi:MAG: GNAT family N-acetyltransferase [Planctomycetes bacterium]|nr:GNAT family N-acetyltransferase [Planctomycetota bacterium]
MDSETPPLSRPVPLEASHDLSTFDCGVPALNEYLKKYALMNHQNQSARTYVARRGSAVVGYYTLAAGSVSREETPTRIAKGLARHPIPILLLARLAVDRTEQGKGVGAGLLKDALLRAAQAADIIGCRAVLVHGKDDTANAFYQRFGFEPSPIDELHLNCLMKDLKASLGS